MTGYEAREIPGDAAFGDLAPPVTVRQFSMADITTALKAKCSPRHLRQPLVVLV